MPSDIVKKETVPHALRDPAFLERTNMEVLDKSGNTVDPASIDMENAAAYRFRQRPGASNSLGLVKFMFPNQFNVYLHDTPADSLFARATRSFSHGCVRLEQPDKLAQYVLGDQPAWTPERIDQAMHGGQETTVKLSRAAAGVSRLLDGAGVGRRHPAVQGRSLRHRRAADGAAGAALDKLKTRAAAAGAAAEAQRPRQRPRAQAIELVAGLQSGAIVARS